MNEHKFPTIADAANVLAELVASGYGDLPVQIVIAPDSTVQALARAAGGSAGGAAIMVEYGGQDGRLPLGMICPERMLGGRAMPSLKHN